MSGKIIVSFECRDADTVAYLSMVYELIEQSFKVGYEGTFLMERLPGLIGIVSDVISERLDDSGYWTDDNGCVFQFDPKDFQDLKKRLNWKKQNG